ncbi:MAG: argininosuccinate lyase, partial [Rikenellaceae bacterium]|nr:argininosuccinate lyase [Rikenellaceae bacterium]
LVDDTQMALAAYRICNRNPLGSAAGYGSSFPLNRTMTTELLGFDSMDYNVVYAQMGRGKTERVVAQAIAAYAATLGKFAMDNTLFLNQNFSFISYPPELTTGSSIMPHKKNPDVWEIIRGKCNLLQALPNQITMLTTNLPTGYHRDLQLMKEVLFPALADMRDIIAMAKMMLENISVVENITADEKYKYMFSVEVVNNMVLGGTPFREAYKTVGLNIEHGKFEVPDTINHTHEGSIGNLCNDRIAELMNGVIAEFGFERVEKAEYDLAH